MKFSVNAAGTISGLRFYKGAQNTGTHIGNLWDANGKKLATVTFANETASGWEQGNFASPVAITAGTTYVVSYHTATGHYAVDQSYFKAAVSNNGINAPIGAGVFVYGNDAFPNQTWNNSNYWVDVLYNPSQTPPAINRAGLFIGVFNPWDTSITPKPQYVPGADRNPAETWVLPGDYLYWENAIGYPAGSISNSGNGIAMDPDSRGGWANYEGSAWTVVQWQYTSGRGADKLWLNVPPWPQHQGHTLAEVATGVDDDHYKAVAGQLMGHGYGQTVWRPIWEFEGGWYEWGWNSGSQNKDTYCTDYVAAFRRMVAAIRSVMPLAQFAFNAADGTIMTPNNGAPQGWQACYPGDDVTDYVAIDTYDGNRSSTTPADARWHQDQVPGITSSQALALEHHKGWAVPEWAIGRLGDNPLYIKNMHDAAASFAAHGSPAFLGYWNGGDGTGYNGYMNTTVNPQSWAEFKKDFHVDAKRR